MIVSYNWLKTLINFDLDPDALSALLTDTGLEVEKVHRIESVKGGLEGLITGHVLSCEPAENADKLNLTKVDVGGEEPLSIVCGAPNVAAGQKVIVAPVGCTIYPVGHEPFKIKKAKIRGHVSEGMICAEDEIGLGTGHDGILVLEDNVAVGQPLSNIIEIETDAQIEIGLTPNRGDAASHLGTARDIKAIVHNDIMMPPVDACDSKETSPIGVSIQNPDMCPRYTGILLDNITVQESPDWLKKRLQSIDLKPINNVVDTTNFVLHELGQPIHAFDADEIDGGIVVRQAKPGEKMTTLDDVERELTGSELLITDPSKPLALAGVFGGLHSGVSSKTTRVFIESAYFDPSTIRKSAKTHGLSTDASFRYERGCDPNITVTALQRVVYILKEVAGARVASAIVDEYPNKVENKEINLSIDWLNTFCGINLSTEEVKNILRQLDIETMRENGGEITVSVPPYRSDVTRPVDLAEEVLRIYGFNQVPIPKRLSMTPAIARDFDPIKTYNKVANFLASKGFHETMSNSQTRKNDRTELAPVELLNPLSIEQSVMRTDMFDGILGSVAHNINRKNKDLLFFEFGKTYGRKEEKFEEHNNLIIVATGKSTAKNWITDSEPADYFFLKGILQSLSEVLGITINRLNKCTTLNKVSKGLLKEHGIKQEVNYALVDWDTLLKQVRRSSFKLEEVPVFPVVTRDLSIVLNLDAPYSKVENLVTQTAGKYLRDMEVFDVYEGDRLPEGKKSYAISVELYDSTQTMTDKKIDQIMENMMTKLEKEVGALIRK